MGNVPPKPETSLQRHLFSAKIHQKQDSLWFPKRLLGPEPSFRKAPGPGRTLTRPPHRAWKGTGLLPFSVFTGHCSRLTLTPHSNMSGCRFFLDRLASLLSGACSMRVPFFSSAMRGLLCCCFWYVDVT